MHKFQEGEDLKGVFSLGYHQETHIRRSILNWVSRRSEKCEEPLTKSLVAIPRRKVSWAAEELRRPELAGLRNAPQIPVKAAILERGRERDGGVNESRQLEEGFN